ncbi:MAG: hypothetical protein QM784_22735 [Polyangiaceae bacterium]
MAEHTRLVLKAPDETTFGAICVANFWLLRAERRGDPEKQLPFELVHASRNGDIQVTYVDDPIADCTYVIVEGAAHAEGCRILRRKLSVFSQEELFSLWDEAPHDSAQIAAILKIGVAAPLEFR